MRTVRLHMRIFFSYSPYAYGDSPYAYGGLVCAQLARGAWVTHLLGKKIACVRIRGFILHELPYAYGDWCNPRMHTVTIKITVRIRGFTTYQSLYAYGYHGSTRMHTVISTNTVCIRRDKIYSSPYAYGDFMYPRMHTGTVQSLTVCITNLCAYGKTRFWSPYAKFCIWGSPYAYGDHCTHTGGDC